MRREAFRTQDTQGVFPVPPLARRNDARAVSISRRTTALSPTSRAPGITRLIYGGNAFLYHVTLAEYEQMLDWLTGLPDPLLAIPSAGPSFGRAMDQAPMLRRRGFPLVMMLPCGDPRDAAGLEAGIRDFAKLPACP